MDVKFLKGTAQKYQELNFKDPNAFYYIDGTNLYLGELKLTSASDLSNAISRIVKNEGDISSIQESLETLIGSDGDTSISKMIETAVNAAKQELNGKIQSIEDSIGEVPKGENLVDMIADAITDATYDDSDLKGRVSANETAIQTLNGDGIGSIKKKIDDAFNQFTSDMTNDEVINTYKELIEWAETHSSDAAEMASDIQENTSAISGLIAIIGDIPDEADVDTIIEYINSKVEAVDFTDEINSAKQSAIETAATDAKTKADKALEDAKEYADGLADDYDPAGSAKAVEDKLEAVLTWGEF